MSGPTPGSMNRAEEHPKAIRLLDFMTALVRRKRFLFWNTFALCALAAIVTLIVEKRYTSTTLLMPPEDAGSILKSQISQSLPIGLLGGDFLGGEGLGETYLTILRSRRIRMATIREFDLVTVYEYDKARRFYIEDVLKELENNVGLSITDNGAISITIEDKSPERAASMANYMAHMLDSISRQLSRERTLYEKEFLEERLTYVENKLRSAEDALVKFQTDHDAVEVDQ